MAKFRSISKVIVGEGIAFSLLFFASGLLPLPAIGQQHSSVQNAYEQLKEPRTTDQAARDLLRLAKGDSVARGYVAERLPGIIESIATTPRQVWMNAVHLAGELKAANTVPSLIKVLPKSPYGSSVIVGFADGYSLRSDPVGEALCGIGNPTVTELSRLLQHGERSSRIRAARILWNIDSAVSRQVLESDIEKETDPGIKLFSRAKSQRE